MNRLILPKTKNLLSASRPLKKLLSPFYKITNVTAFGYARIYNDQGLIDICDHQDITEGAYFDNNELYTDASPDICPEQLQNEFILLSCHNSDNPALKFLFNLKGISDALVLTKFNHTYYETFWFCSNSYNKFVNYCINNLHVFESFTYYFRNSDDVKNIITTCENDRMFRYISEDVKLRNKKFISDNKQKSTDLNDGGHYNMFCDIIKKRYYVPGKSSSYLTKREMDCFYWCVQGKTSEETAIILQLSKRTVENHLATIKQKLDCTNKTALIRIAYTLGIF